MLIRSSGQHVAIIAGLQHCAGDCALLIDGDLEMPPSEIPKLYKEFETGIEFTDYTKIKINLLLEISSLNYLITL